MLKKSKSYIVIPGDPVSADEIFLTLEKERLGRLRFQMEKIRVSDLSPEKKRVEQSSLTWRIRALEEQIRQRS